MKLKCVQAIEVTLSEHEVTVIHDALSIAAHAMDEKNNSAKSRELREVLQELKDLLWPSEDK